jgi:hypothetical protein
MLLIALIMPCMDECAAGPTPRAATAGAKKQREPLFMAKRTPATRSR